MNSGRIKRFSIVVVTDPEAAKKAVYTSGADAPRFSGAPCLVPGPGPDMLSDLDTILCGGHSKDVRANGLSLLRPDGPLNVRSPVSRHLYRFSPDFCERLRAMTDADIHQIAVNWYQLLFPFLGPDKLTSLSKRDSKHSERMLCALARLADVATQRHESLLLYVETRRAMR